jgi:hypothetical protein
MKQSPVTEQMYFLSLRKPATKYAYMPFLFPGEIPAYHLETIDAMGKTKPLFVLHFSGDSQGLQPDNVLQAYILENYELVKTHKLQQPLYKTINYCLIFRRNGG